MTVLFETTYEDIKALKDFQLTDLLRRLLHLECACYGITAAGVCVSLAINIPDGGEDGRIEWTGGPEVTNYIPRRLTMFQCKATDMGPTDCAKELLQKNSNKLKPRVESVLDASGSYILFTSQALNGNLISERIIKMREAIRTAGKTYADTADLHIYDANKVSDWTNKYLAAVVAVSLWRGRPLLQGILTWEEWSNYNDHFHFPFVPSGETDGYSQQLQQVLSEPRQVARIVGLSGLGKTRLALETFRPSSEAVCGSRGLHYRVVYLDAGQGIPPLSATISDWRRLALEGILVVDNCDLSLHKQLKAEIEHTESKLSLLTLDYHVEETPGTPLIKLGPRPDTLIKEMLKKVYESLPESELERIANFAQGFPRMAVMLANARLNEEPDMGSLRDPDFLWKLLWGRGSENQEARKVISACALFEHLGFVEDRAEEYLFVAEHICRVPAEDFYGYIDDFNRRGIIDKRGRYIRVVPLPLAVRLAADWWRRCSPERARELILGKLPGGLSEALCERVAKLDFLPRARELVKDLCGESGPFGQAEVLNSKRGSRLFRSLAEVNPEVATQTLSRAFGQKSKKELVQVGSGRRDIIWTLEKLCFRRETFPVAARVLLAFAIAENENWSNNATGLFEQLFHVFLSGTEAPPNERLAIIDETIKSGDPDQFRIAISALGHALQTHHFHRSGLPEHQGSGPALRDWHPHLWQDVFEYWREALQRLTSIATGNGDEAVLARDEVAKCIRGLVSYGRIDALEQALDQIVQRHGPYWPKALEEVRNAIRYEKNNIPIEELKRLDSWLEMLQPQTMPERLKLIVSLPSWGDGKFGEGDEYIDYAEERAKQLAEECAKNLEPWLVHFSVIFQGEQRKGYIFGYRLGECLKQTKRFLDAALETLAGLAEQNGNPIVFAGFLAAVKPVNPGLVHQALETAAKSESLCRYLVDLTRATQPSLFDLQRLLDPMESGCIPVDALNVFCYGRPLSHLPPDDVIRFINNLLPYGSKGIWTSIHILFMYQYTKPDLWPPLKTTFRSLILHPNLDLTEQARNDLHYWQKIAEKLLKEDDTEFARELASRMLLACAGAETSPDFHYAYQPVAKILFENYRDVIWPLFSEVLLSDNEIEVFRLSGLLGARYRSEGKKGSIFAVIPDDFLLKWCEKHPNKAPSILASSIILLKEVDAVWDWTPLARAIIDRYGNQHDVLSSLDMNIGSYSWVGSLVPYYQRQVRPFENLRHHSFPQVRSWAEEHLRYIEEQTKRESTRDEERNSGIF